MGNEYSVHNVSRIRVVVDSAPIHGGQDTVYWQRFIFHSPKGRVLGKVVAFLTDPTAALPVAEKPPCRDDGHAALEDEDWSDKDPF